MAGWIEDAYTPTGNPAVNYIDSTSTFGGGGGVNWGALAKALQQPSQDAKGQKGPAPIQATTGPAAQAQPGQPRRPLSLDQLVQLLEQQANAYQQASMTPGAVVSPPALKPMGLLGF